MKLKSLCLVLNLRQSSHAHTMIASKAVALFLGGLFFWDHFPPVFFNPLPPKKIIPPKIKRLLRRLIQSIFTLPPCKKKIFLVRIPGEKQGSAFFEVFLKIIFEIIC